MNITDIQKGNNLNLAKESSIDDFFMKRIYNKIRKANVGNYEILFTDNEFIYYAYPVFKFPLFFTTRIIDELFKVKKKELTEKFPGFASITGVEIRILLYPAIFNYAKKNVPDLLDLRFINDYQAKLQDQGIEIIQNCELHSKNQKYQKKFIIMLNKTSGKVIIIK